MYITQTQQTFDIKSLIKVVGFICAGSMAAFALFVLMGKLIYSNDTSYAEPKETITVDILGVTEEQATQTIKPQLPQPPVKATPPPRPTPLENTASNDIGISIGGIDVSVPEVGLGDFSMDGPSNNDAVAIVQVEPRYPTEAARDGIEGWVTLSFTVDELGQVTDVKVMDANPKRIFNREAQKALKKWKYRPKVVDGKPVRQPGQSVLLEFNLGQ